MNRNRASRRHPFRRLLSFPLLRPGRRQGAPPLSEEEILFELAGQNPKNRLFGRFGPEEVRQRLRKAGILDGLAMRGYDDPLLVLDCEDPAEQRISLHAGEASRDRLLMEARLQVGTFSPGRPVGPFSENSVFRMLIIHWLLLSDPDRPFTVDRPRLPGQERPGLGLMKPCLSLLGEIAREFLLDGVLDVPDHFHAALFYSRSFRFLEPEIEGRFQATVRDLAGVPLALASDAIAEGCLVNAETGEAVPWLPAEQVSPIRGPLRRRLRSSDYRDRRNDAAAALRVAVDWDRYRQKIAASHQDGNSP